MFFRKKKEKEPASYLSPLGTELTNYNVYYLNFREKLRLKLEPMPRSIPVSTTGIIIMAVN